MIFKKILGHWKQALCYVLGLFVITIGINISKMSNLGISPASSIPRAGELITSKFGFPITLGICSIIVYTLLVLLQVIILRKKFKLINILGIALAFGFGFMVDITGTDPNAFGHLLLNFPKPQDIVSGGFLLYLVQFGYMLVSLVIIGIGVFMYLLPKWIPMPAEGLAGAISEVSGKSFGDCKTIVDVSMIVIATILQIIFLGGFKSFVGIEFVDKFGNEVHTMCIREGTVISAIFVGQIVKFLFKKLGPKATDLITPKYIKEAAAAEASAEETKENDNV